MFRQLAPLLGHWGCGYACAISAASIAGQLTLPAPSWNFTSSVVSAVAYKMSDEHPLGSLMLMNLVRATVLFTAVLLWWHVWSSCTYTDVDWVARVSSLLIPITFSFLSSWWCLWIFTESGTNQSDLLFLYRCIFLCGAPPELLCPVCADVLCSIRHWLHNTAAEVLSADRLCWGSW